MTPQDLKNSVLQRAIQGKLVPQDPNEGSGEELLRQIREEKSRLLKDGKIKKEKPLPDIDDEEKPFEIPDNWVWVRLQDCGYFISGYTPKSEFLKSVGNIPYFKVSDMNTIGNEKYLSLTSNYLDGDTSKIKTFERGTIVYPKNGGAVFTNKKRIITTSSVVDLNTGGFKPVDCVYLNYFFMYFQTIDFRQYYKGTALPTIDMEKVRNKLLPLPPLSEQKRIVSKLESLQPHIESYGRAWTRLEELSTRFPSELRKSLLQRAIEGRLVARDPSEGTGADLLREIQKEKKRLVEEGKIKKEKPLPEITDDEKPFEIPGHWTWVRLGEVIKLSSGRDLEPLEYNSEQRGIPYLTGASNIDKDENVIINRWTEFAKVIAVKGNLLLTCKGTIGKISILQESSVHIARQIMGIMPYSVNTLFLKYFLSVTQWKPKSMIPGIERNDVLQLLFPLPPLSEQKRIVSKLEELLPLCERLTVVRS